MVAVANRAGGARFADREYSEDDDDAWCEDLLERYLADPDESKHDAITLEEFAAREGITGDDPFYSKENIEHLEELKRLDDMGLLKFTKHELVQV